MTDDTTQGQDRVAAVVARVVHHGITGNRGLPMLLDNLIAALDAAGLLLTEARRGEIVALLRDDTPPIPMAEFHRRRIALLRELARDGGAAPAPRWMAANPASAGDTPSTRLHAVEHNENEGCTFDPPCQPVAAAGVGSPLVAPAHEHRWAAVAWAATVELSDKGCGLSAENWRVTREHCVVGDCTATREVGHGA